MRGFFGRLVGLLNGWCAVFDVFKRFPLSSSFARYCLGCFQGIIHLQMENVYKS